MDLSRMYRIAETGDVNDPTPVDNVLRMAEERQRQQQQARPQSAWGRFKNFVDSNAGRTLWGGFGAGLGVVLTGGDFKNALGYGVIGCLLYTSPSPRDRTDNQGTDRKTGKNRPDYFGKQ